MDINSNAPEAAFLDGSLEFGWLGFFGGPARSASEREIREYHDARIVRAALTRRPVSASRGHIALRRRGQF